MELRDPGSVSAMQREAANPRNRLFVVYLDVFHTAMFDSQSVRTPLLEFLRRAVGATDLFGVMTPETPINALTFARRLDTIEGELNRMPNWGIGDLKAGAPRTPHEERLYQCAGPDILPAHREDLFYTSLERLITHLGGLRDERKNLLLVTGRLRAARGDRGVGSMAVGAPTGSRGGPPSMPRPGVGRSGTLTMAGGDERAGLGDSNWCSAELSRLASIDYERRFRELLTTAQRANVSIHPVDTGGLRVSGGSTDMLRTLAENTGGTAVVDTNDLGGALRRVAEEQSAFYLIGYRSTNQAADGRYRRIEVKLAQRGIDVTARHGYLGWTEEMRRAEAAALARPRPETSDVDVALANLGRARPDATLHGHAVQQRDEVVVVSEIASREMESGRWKAGAKVSVTLMGPDGARRVGEGVIAPGARSTLMRVPLDAAPAGAWRARLVATGDGQSAEEDIDVVPMAAASALAGPPIVYRGGTSVRLPAVPTATSVFRRVERLVVEWPIAATLDGLSARVLNIRGEPLPIPVTIVERETDGRRVAAVDLRLAALATGDYVIEAKLERGGATERLLFAVRVTP